jgi:hypothetical protein
LKYVFGLDTILENKFIEGDQIICNRSGRS